MSTVSKSIDLRRRGLVSHVMPCRSALLSAHSSHSRHCACSASCCLGCGARLWWYSVVVYGAGGECGPSVYGHGGHNLVKYPRARKGRNTRADPDWTGIRCRIVQSKRWRLHALTPMHLRTPLAFRFFQCKTDDASQASKVTLVRLTNNY